MKWTVLYQEIVDYCETNANPEKNIWDAWKLKPLPNEAFLLKYKVTAPRTIYQCASKKSVGK